MKKPSAIRLAIALLASAVLMAALATGAAFLIYGSWEVEAYAVRAKTRFAAMVAISAFLAFNFTAGLATILLLRRMGRAGVAAHALGGAAAGVVFALISAVGFGQPVEPVVLLVLAVIGALMVLLIRAFAGVRRPC